MIEAGELASSTGKLVAKKPAGQQQREVQQLRKQLEERDQIIGELTVANTFLKKISGQSA